MENETIAALSTAPYKAAIGVIRVPGEKSFEIVGRIFNKNIEAAASSATVMHGNIVDGAEPVDDVILTVFRAPKSYTGENVAEISCHGGLYICHKILKLLIKNGARQARNGEFSKRAFMNGKLDLLQAEAVINLIDSESRAEARAAIGGLNGQLSRKINAVRDELLQISAQLLAFIDYPDDEIPEITPDALRKSITEAHKKIDALASSYDSGKIIKDGIKTVITGKPNVGKSTLMNLLSGEDKSIVTEIAGTTRDVIESQAQIGGVKLRLFDTAGVRKNADASDIVEKIGIERTLAKIREAGLILCVFDASGEKSVEDEAILNEIEKSDAKKLIILNKTDLGVIFDEKTVTGAEVIHMSAQTGEGFSALENAVSRLFPIGGEVQENSGIIMDLRQFECLTEASRALENALDNLHMTPDALLSDIENAINSLGLLTGKTVSEEITENIFSRFCVGK